VKPVHVHQDAEAELRQALDYYERQRIGLGGRFRRELEAALQRVRENPQAYAIEDDLGTRYCPVNRFPYTLVYVELDDRIWVAAVAHQRRRPCYWLLGSPPSQLRRPFRKDAEVGNHASGTPAA
jgi:toxin ParE1/3/4